jgi:predicted component of type VI protein secretion system
MLQFQILSGKSAGLLWDARRFPVRVGRAPANDLPLEDDGVWNEHFQVALQSGEGFLLSAQPGAIVAINQSPATTHRLRNGDIITAGCVRLRFHLGDPRQRGLQLQEWIAWGLALAAFLVEGALIGWLLR